MRGARRFSLSRLCARRPLILAAAMAAICLIPVRQSVLAPATLAAIEPRIVSARTDGVIREINLPNCGTLPDFGNFCLRKEKKQCWSGNMY